jgi:hypothetical protein
MYVADRQQWPGNDTLLLVLKTYPNGWADVRTSEDQVASINMNQIVRVYRIDDVEKWKRMRGK